VAAVENNLGTVDSGERNDNGGIGGSGCHGGNGGTSGRHGGGGGDLNARPCNMVSTVSTCRVASTGRCTGGALMLTPSTVEPMACREPGEKSTPELPINRQRVATSERAVRRVLRWHRVGVPSGVTASRTMTFTNG
jgi:hypothetical protein